MAGFGMGLAAVRRYIIINFPIIFPKQIIRMCVYFSSVQFSTWQRRHTIIVSTLQFQIQSENIIFHI